MAKNSLNALSGVRGFLTLRTSHPTRRSIGCLNALSGVRGFLTCKGVGGYSQPTCSGLNALSGVRGFLTY